MMPEPDGGIPSTGDPRVDAALERIRGKFKDLEDALVVQAHLEKKAGERIKEHAQLIADHDEWIKEMQVKMSEMTEKVNFLLNREMRREGGPEAR